VGLNTLEGRRVRFSATAPLTPRQQIGLVPSDMGTPIPKEDVMDTKTGQIAYFDSEEAARRAGFDEQLTPGEAARLLTVRGPQRNRELQRIREASDRPLNRKEARAELRRQRKAQRV
jgi:hypothetical protein